MVCNAMGNAPSANRGNSEHSQAGIEQHNFELLQQINLAGVPCFEEKLISKIGGIHLEPFNRWNVIVVRQFDFSDAEIIKRFRHKKLPKLALMKSE